MPRHRLVRATAGRPFHQGRDVIVSISACDADCAGANPVALTISISMGRSLWIIAQPKRNRMRM